MASAAPASSSAKRALRKRKLQASLESGSASFGSVNHPKNFKPPRNLGRPLTEAERAVHMLATPWPKSKGASGALFHSYINEVPEESNLISAKVDIKHSPSSPTG